MAQQYHFSSAVMAKLPEGVKDYIQTGAWRQLVPECDDMCSDIILRTFQINVLPSF